MGSHTLEDAHGGGVVVDAAGGAQRGGDDGRGGDQVVGEGVVQVALVLVGNMSAGLPRLLIMQPGRSASLGGSASRWEGRRTWSSKTSWTLSNSFSYLHHKGHPSAIEPLQCHQLPPIGPH